MLAALGVVAIVLFGLGAKAAFNYSDNPQSCILCHTMREAYETHMNSNHSQFTCMDCHAPQETVSKLVFKTKSGMRDLYVTLTGQVPERIEVTEESREIIKNNCIRCHYRTVDHVEIGQEQHCTGCHRGVPHGTS